MYTKYYNNLSVITPDYNNIKKRKYDQFSNYFNCKSFDYNVYDSSLYCIDNHIYFNCIIDDFNMNKLKNIVLQLRSNYSFHQTDSFIYLHINKNYNSNYGYLSALINNIDIFLTSKIPLISIVHSNISDIYIILSSLCKYSYVYKNVLITINKLQNNYWNNCNQCNSLNNIELKSNIINIFNYITNNKIKNNKLVNYLDNGFVMNSKKAKKNYLFSGII